MIEVNGFEKENGKQKKGTLKAQKVLNPDLSNENKRVRQHSHLVRALEEPLLKRFKGALGTTFGVANPTPVPTLKDIDARKKKANVPLKKSTLVRITTCREKDEDAVEDMDIVPVAVASSQAITSDNSEAETARIQRQMWAKRCPFPGMDMEYLETETGLTDLHFGRRFKKMRGDSEPVMDLLREPPIDDTDTENEDDTAVQIGDKLVYQESLHRVVTLSKNGAGIVRAFGTGNPTINIGIEECTDLVNKYGL